MTVKVATYRVPDNKSYTTSDSGSIASLIETWLGTLTIATVYGMIIEHHQGFWICIIVYSES